MKKIITLLFILSFCLLQVNVSAFSDVPQSSPFYKATRYLRQKNILSDNRNFNLDNTLTRAELTKVALLSTNIKIEKAPSKPFKDLTADMWIYDIAYTAKKHNILDGYEDGTFRPQRGVTWIEALKILMNTTQKNKNPKLSIKNIYSDVGQDNWWAPYIALGIEKNFFDKPSTNKFGIQKNFQRKHMAQVLYRSLLINERKTNKYTSSLDQDTSDKAESQEGALSSSQTAIDDQGNTYKVGYTQVSSKNQDPFVAKIDKNGNQLWKVVHESSPVDGRAILVNVDSNNQPWVVFSVDGGSYDAGYITKKSVEADAFKGVYQHSYGRGGGAKVSVLAKINPDNGLITKATFVTARITSGKTNTLKIKELGFSGNNPVVKVSSSAWPPGAGSKYTRFPSITDQDRIDGSFKVKYVFAEDLSSITDASLIR